MVRFCGIMTTVVEGAGWRSRDSAQHAAPRPGSGDLVGAMDALLRPQRRLCDGDCVYFCTKVIDLCLGNTNMINADMAPEKAHNEDIKGGRKTGIVLVAWCNTRADSCMFMLFERHFLHSDPILFCTKLIGIIRITAISLIK